MLCCTPGGLSGPGPPKPLASGDQLGRWLQLGAPGAREAEGSNKVTTGSSAFISPGCSQLQVSNLISAASCFLRCMAVPRHPLTCHQPREGGRVGRGWAWGSACLGPSPTLRGRTGAAAGLAHLAAPCREQGSARPRNGRGGGGGRGTQTPTRGPAEAPLPTQAEPPGSQLASPDQMT